MKFPTFTGNYAEKKLIIKEKLQKIKKYKISSINWDKYNIGNRRCYDKWK